MRKLRGLLQIFKPRTGLRLCLGAGRCLPAIVALSMRSSFILQESEILSLEGIRIKLVCIEIIAVS